MFCVAIKIFQDEGRLTGHEDIIAWVVGFKDEFAIFDDQQVVNFMLVRSRQNIKQLVDGLFIHTNITKRRGRPAINGYQGFLVSTF
jgi:hypothetical protein